MQRQLSDFQVLEARRLWANRSKNGLSLRKIIEQLAITISAGALHKAVTHKSYNTSKERPGNCKLSSGEVKFIRLYMKNSGVRWHTKDRRILVRKLAKEYRVTERAINKILRRTTWAT